MTTRTDSAARPDGGTGGEVRHDRYVGGQDLTRWSTPAGRAAAWVAVRTSQRVGSRLTLVLVLGIGLLVAFLAAFAVARVYDGVSEHDGVAGLDLPALHAAMAIRSPFLDALAAGIAYVFGPVGMPIIAVVVLTVLAVRRRSWTPVILIAASGVGSLLMTLAGKGIIGRHRPPLADAIRPFEYSPSFPSGHTLNATVIAGVVAYLLILRERSAISRTLTAAAAVLVAIVVGASRILLGAHWFTDVLAGWLLGAGWLALVITAHRLYLTTRRHQVAEPLEPAGGR